MYLREEVVFCDWSHDQRGVLRLRLSGRVVFTGRNANRQAACGPARDDCQATGAEREMLGVLVSLHS
ncbi:MAG: hypothetical protein ACLQIB_46095 [Isosphaeraceae bacterium]